VPDSQRVAVENAVRRCYDAAGLSRPSTIVWAPSPVAGVHAAVIAARHLGPHDRRFQAVRRWIRPMLLAIGLALFVGFWGAIFTEMLFGCLFGIIGHYPGPVLTPLIGAGAGAVGAIFWCRAELWADWVANGATGLEQRMLEQALALIESTGARIERACAGTLAPPPGAHTIDAAIRQAMRWSEGAQPAPSAGDLVEAIVGVRPAIDRLPFWPGIAGCSAFRRDVPASEAWVTAGGTFWWAHPTFAVISEPPSRLRTETLPDGMITLHDPDGPALSWPGGPEFWYWHGVPVPSTLITPGWTIRDIRMARNNDVRRMAMERMGWLRYLDEADMRLVAVCPDPGNPPHTLAIYEDVTGLLEDTRILVMTNGSPDRSGVLRRFAEPVPARFDDPVEAAAWQYGIPVASYRTLTRRT
jgi:hypothetical protein